MRVPVRVLLAFFHVALETETRVRRAVALAVRVADFAAFQSDAARRVLSRRHGKSGHQYGCAD
jgi:hypothetical protein